MNATEPDSPRCSASMDPRWLRLVMAAIALVIVRFWVAQGLTSAQGGAAEWRSLETTGQPQSRYTHGAAFDERRSRMIVFGGDDDGVARLNDTWELDGRQWRQVNTPTRPPGRVNIDQTMVYDSHRGVTVMFGGLGQDGYLDDTWEFSGSDWRMTANAGPSARDAHAMAFDSRRKISILFGGVLGDPMGDMWTYDGDWTQWAPATLPSPRFHHSMSYDARRDRLVLFGGQGKEGLLDDTWEFDGLDWRVVNTRHHPPSLENHALAYDRRRGVTVLFGGVTLDGPMDDTWEYDGSDWVRQPVPRAPAPRGEMNLVYDTLRQQLVMFGGGHWDSGNLITHADTWLYQPSVAPAAVHTAHFPAVLRSWNRSQAEPPPISTTPVPTQESTTVPTRVPSPTRTAAATPTTQGGKPQEAINVRVLVISYDPLLSNGKRLHEEMGWKDHHELTSDAVAFFADASHGNIVIDVVDTVDVDDGWPVKMDGFRYSEEDYLSVRRGTASAHRPDAVDYDRIVGDSRFDICGRVNRGEVDEVWIYNGPDFGFYESRLTGPGAYNYNSPPLATSNGCQKLVPIMGPSVERNLDASMHNFGHRTEAAMTKVYGEWRQNRVANRWETFALVDSLSSDFAVSGCGNTHYPPNAKDDYDYANNANSESYCDAFGANADPEWNTLASQPKTVSCARWDCTELGFLRYWFSKLPSASGCGRDGMLNNWWRYVFEPALPLDARAHCPSG